MAQALTICMAGGAMMDAKLAGNDVSFENLTQGFGPGKGRGFHCLLSVPDESVAKARKLVLQRPSLERLLTSAAGNLQNPNIGMGSTL
eukprot:357889-Rhodomonas_salina.1